MRLLIIFIFLLSNSFAKEVPNIKNIVINKELKTYKNLAFLDSKQEIVELNNYKGKLVMLNFWATWCNPCKEEMPSLDSLKSNKLLDNLEIFPINIGKDNLKKSQKFFRELNIENLEIYFDNPITLTKELSLRGVPTTIIFNRKGKEFARIIGSIDFSDKSFIEWLSTYN
jgi:thiol-disulfide isomerase/thioredoxin